jgi:hypothetical protein
LRWPTMIIVGSFYVIFVTMEMRHVKTFSFNLWSAAYTRAVDERSTGAAAG